MSWKAGAPGGIFPALDADLEISRLGDHRTQLAISGRYRPPMGALGRVLDRSLLHVVAEATIKDFLDRVAERLVSRAGEDVDPVAGTMAP
jgi:hypothetical protein